MSIGTARRRFGATLCRDGSVNLERPRRAASLAGVWRYLETPCILLIIVLGNVAVVKIVDALLDALHN